MIQDKIIVIDLGSPKNTDIARSIRAMGVYSEIYPHDITVENLQSKDNLKGIILNGGVNRNVDGQDVTISDALYDLNIPMIAIDYPQSKLVENLTELPSEETLVDFVFT